MRAITVSRTVAALAALTLAGGCSDSLDPLPNDPSTEGMTVVPRSATIHSGQVVALKAQLIDALGNPMEGVTINWASSNDAVATVAATGTVQGHAEGRAVITASAQGKSQFSSILVLKRDPKPESKPKPKPLLLRRRAR